MKHLICALFFTGMALGFAACGHEAQAAFAPASHAGR
jgi:hypothetical protein